MQFVLTGFTQDLGFRVFAFEGIGADRIRTKFTVKAELALIRNYGIRIQELPLLCRGLLDRRTLLLPRHGGSAAGRRLADNGHARVGHALGLH